MQVQPLGRDDPQRRKWHPIPGLLTGNSMDRGAWQAAVYGITEMDTTERTHTHTHSPKLWERK